MGTSPKSSGVERAGTTGFWLALQRIAPDIAFEIESVRLSRATLAKEDGKVAYQIRVAARAVSGGVQLVGDGLLDEYRMLANEPFGDVGGYLPHLVLRAVKNLRQHKPSVTQSDAQLALQMGSVDRFVDSVMKQEPFDERPEPAVRDVAELKARLGAVAPRVAFRLSTHDSTVASAEAGEVLHDLWAEASTVSNGKVLRGQAVLQGFRKDDAGPDGLAGGKVLQLFADALYGLRSEARQAGNPEVRAALDRAEYELSSIINASQDRADQLPAGHSREPSRKAGVRR